MTARGTLAPASATVPGAERGYRAGRDIIAEAGRTYHLAARLLPAPSRRAVYALYAFARLVDDIVDDQVFDDDSARRAARTLDRVEDGLRQALDGGPEPHGELPAALADAIAAVADTARTFEIDPATFHAFLTSMRMDVPGTAGFRNRYASMAELAGYTYGSAAVIGLQLLPVLGAPAGDPELAAGAALLGEAFQLTNFLRDTAEDARRNRIYLPLDALAAFGAGPDDVLVGAASGSTPLPVRRAVAHLIAINRDQYRRAAPAIAALPRRTRPAIAAAARSYHSITEVIERSDFDVMAGRARVPRSRRLRQAAASLLTAPEF